MKGELPVVGGRVPHGLKAKLTAFCAETGHTESQVIRDALSAYLGVNTPDTVRSLDKRVAALERKVMKLTQMIHCMGMTNRQVNQYLRQVLSVLSQRYGITQFEPEIRLEAIECPINPCPLKER